MPYKVEIVKPEELENKLNAGEMDMLAPAFVVPFFKKILVVFFRPFLVEQLGGGGMPAALNKMMAAGSPPQKPGADKGFGLKSHQ